MQRIIPFSGPIMCITQVKVSDFETCIAQTCSDLPNIQSEKTRIERDQADLLHVNLMSPILRINVENYSPRNLCLQRNTYWVPSPFGDEFHKVPFSRKTAAKRRILASSSARSSSPFVTSFLKTNFCQTTHSLLSLCGPYRNPGLHPWCIRMQAEEKRHT